MVRRPATQVAEEPHADEEMVPDEGSVRIRDREAQNEGQDMPYSRPGPAPERYLPEDAVCRHCPSNMGNHSI